MGRTQEEITQIYEGYIRDCLQAGDQLANLKREVLKIFSSEVVIGKDEAGKDILTAHHEDQVFDQKDIDKTFADYKTALKNGCPMLREIERTGAGLNLFPMMYALSHGVSLDDLINLHEHPESAGAAVTRTQMRNMKQDYFDLVTSGDKEKLVDMMMGFSKVYADNFHYIIDAFDPAKAADRSHNMKRAVLLSGGVTLFQQSLSPTRFSDATKDQRELIGMLDKKLQEAYGEEFGTCQLTGISGLMDAIARGRGQMQKYMKGDHNNCSALEGMSCTLMGMRFIRDAYQENIRKGMRYPGMARNISILSLNTMAPDDMEDYYLPYSAYYVEDENGEERKKFGNALLQEADFALGDDSGHAFHDVRQMKTGKFTPFVKDDPFSADLMDVASKNRIYTLSGEEIHKLYLSAVAETEPRQFRKGRDVDGNRVWIYRKDNTHVDRFFHDIIKEKVANNERMTNPEISVYLRFMSSSEKEEYNEFFSHPNTCKFTDLSDNMRLLLRSKVWNEFGMTAREYLSGSGAMKNKLQESYGSMVGDLKANRLNGYQTRMRPFDKTLLFDMVQDMKRDLIDVKAGVGSSSQWKHLDETFRKLGDKPVDFPQDNHKDMSEYRRLMQEIAEAADAYTGKFHSDNRSTEKGRKRYNLAERMKTFALENVRGMARVLDACEAQKIRDLIDLDMDNPMDMSVENLNQPSPGKRMVKLAQIEKSAGKNKGTETMNAPRDKKPVIPRNGTGTGMKK